MNTWYEQFKWESQIHPQLSPLEPLPAERVASCLLNAAGAALSRGRRVDAAAGTQQQQHLIAAAVGNACNSFAWVVGVGGGGTLMVVRDHHQRSWWGTTIKASRGWFGWVEAGGVGCPALRGPLYCSTLFFL